MELQAGCCAGVVRRILLSALVDFGDCDVGDHVADGSATWLVRLAHHDGNLCLFGLGRWFGSLGSPPTLIGTDRLVLDAQLYRSVVDDVQSVFCTQQCSGLVGLVSTLLGWTTQLLCSRNPFLPSNDPKRSVFHDFDRGLLCRRSQNLLA